MSLNGEQQNLFNSILESARTQGETGSHVTNIVSGHLNQMSSLIIQKGIYFYSKQDTFKKRTASIQKWILANRIDIRLPAIIRNFLIDGKGLFYLQPDKDKEYLIHYFKKDQYRVYRDASGNLEELIIIYSYFVRNSLSALPGQHNRGLERWVRMSVTATEIKVLESDAKLSFENNIDNVGLANEKVYPNDLGYIPACEVLNNPNESATEGYGEFDQYALKIVEHNRVVESIIDNIDFFGQPTLVSSLEKSQLITTNSGQGVYRPTVASNSGFRSNTTPSTYKTDPFGLGGGGGARVRVPRVIHGVQPQDKVGYIQVDPVPGDLIRYAMQLREEVRTDLGGVDEISISAGATAFELKGLYGRAIATAKVKAKSLLDWGLCQILSYAIRNEEQKFKDSFSELTGLNLQKPSQSIPNSPQELIERRSEIMIKWELLRDQMIQQALEQGTLPPGVIGLPPDGTTEIVWRNEGSVFEDSAQDQYNKSIVVRNLQELGVNTTEAVRFMFPDKNDGEIQQMLTGMPFRVVGAAQQNFQQFAGLVANLMQTPHPENPQIPLAADPRLNFMPMLIRAYQYMSQEMSYGGQYVPDDPMFDPRKTAKLTKKEVKEFEQQQKQAIAAAQGTMPSQYPGYGSLNQGFYAPNTEAGAAIQGNQYSLPAKPVSTPIAPVGLQPSPMPVMPGQMLPAGTNDFQIPSPGITMSEAPNSVTYPGALPINTYQNSLPYQGLQIGAPDLSYMAMQNPQFIAGLIAPPRVV